MKKYLLIALVLVTMILSGCQNDLPPEPGSPEVAGKATYEADFSEPDDFEVRYNPLNYNYDSEYATQEVISSADYVWHTGYYLSAEGNSWLPIEFDGPSVSGGKWIQGTGVSKWSYESNTLSIDSKGVVLAYSCNKVNNVWDCHGNKWMLDTFDFEYSLCTDGDRLCVGNRVDVCSNNEWITENVCSNLEVCMDGQCVLDLPEDPNGPGDFSEQDDIVKIEIEGNKYNLYQTIGMIAEPYSYHNFPYLLNLEVFDDTKGDNTNDYEYKQSLIFSNDNGEFNLRDLVDYGGDLEYSLKIEEGKNVYTYILDFATPVAYNINSHVEDFAGNKLFIQGQEYVISDAGIFEGVLDELTLITSDTTVWLNLGQKFNVGDKTVTVVNIGNDATTCGVEVNGEIQWIDELTTSSFSNGFNVGILDILDSDISENIRCYLSLGAGEIVLENGKDVVINGDSLNSAIVTFQGTSGQWDGFTINYREDRNDDMYIFVGDSWVDPVFSNWKIVMDSVNNGLNSGNGDGLEFNSNSYYGGTLSFRNPEGYDVRIPYFTYAYVNNIDGFGIKLGESFDEPLLIPNSGFVSDDGDISGVLLLHTTKENSPHVLEIIDVDCTDTTKNTTTLLDQTTGEKFTSEIVCGGKNKIKIGELGVLDLVLTPNHVEYTENEYTNYNMQTQYGAIIKFNDESIRLIEQPSNEVAQSSVTYHLEYDLGNNKIGVAMTVDNNLEIHRYSQEDSILFTVTPRGSI